MTRFIRFLPLLAGLATIVFLADIVSGYPIDGYKQTGIRRLERLRLVMADSLRGTKLPPGALNAIREIKLNLKGAKGDSLDSLPVMDRQLQKELDALFPNRHESYSLALLDITPGRRTRFAARQETRQFSPGSVGKLCVAAGLFAELQSLYPRDTRKRVELLRSRRISGGKWIESDHHEVPVYDPATKAYANRKVQAGDVFSLYEWLDHMLSASSNAAASVVWKEVVLMRRFGPQYPPTPEEEQRFLDTTARRKLMEMTTAVVNEPLRAIGISDTDWRLGSLFTSAGKRMLPGEGGSTATATGYLQYLIALERGKIVDEWSSLELKRMMYMTARRIRYASSPRLETAAVYFKSGSLYRCREEPDFACQKYMGNVENVMNSVAIVEFPGGRTYLVALLSNILRKNSAVEHQSIATFLDRLIEKSGPAGGGSPEKPR